MTVEEFRNLKVGDVIELAHYWYELTEISSTECCKIFYNFECNKNRKFVICEKDNEFDITVFVDGRTAFNKLNERNFNIKKIQKEQADIIKRNKKERREAELRKIIQTKETELENLKKEYEEIKRKNMLDRIVPGNVYRFTYNEESYVRLIREIYESKIYTTDLVRGYQDSFYIDGFKNVEHLPELTEAYKNFKTLIESA